MKQKILDALKTKFAGVKDEILDRIATKAAKTVTSDEELTTYVEGVTFQTIIDAEGDRRATDAQKTAVANYEKKHNLKDGKVIEQPKPTEKPVEDPDTPAWAKALIDSNKALSERLAAMEGDKLATTRKAKLAELLKDAPENVQKMYESNFAAMSFADDTAFDAWLEGSKPIIEGLVNDYKAKGAIVTPPRGGRNVPPKGEVNPALKAQVEAAKQAQQVTTMGSTIMGMPQAPAAN